MPALLQAVRDYRGTAQTRLGLQLLLLTGELRQTRPGEFDLERGLWNIPPGHVKQLQRKMRRTGQEVPLSTQAIKIVRELLGALRPSQPYLLWNERNPGEGIGPNTLNSALKRLGLPG
jgi:integrase